MGLRKGEGERWGEGGGRGDRERWRGIYIIMSSTCFQNVWDKFLVYHTIQGEAEKEGERERRETTPEDEYSCPLHVPMMSETRPWFVCQQNQTLAQLPPKQQLYKICKRDKETRRITFLPGPLQGWICSHARRINSECCPTYVSEPIQTIIFPKYQLVYAIRAGNLCAGMCYHGHSV